MAGFRIRSESEPVRMGDTVCMQSIQMPTMYLHVDTEQDGQTEVNCIDVATRYRVRPEMPSPRHMMHRRACLCITKDGVLKVLHLNFRQVVPVAKGEDILAKNRGLVCGGNYVTLFQRQTQTYLHRDLDGKPVCIEIDGVRPSTQLCPAL